MIVNFSQFCGLLEKFIYLGVRTYSWKSLLQIFDILKYV